jgi:hypothetical protein
MTPGTLSGAVTRQKVFMRLAPSPARLQKLSVILVSDV